MESNVLKTSADDLYELVKARKKISIEEAATVLKMPVDTVNALVEFLVEEQLFGIEYKFTTPYIYVSDKQKKSHKKSLELMSKEEFFEQSKKWNMPYERVHALWQKYLAENITLIRDEFFKKAKERNLSDHQVTQLWAKYQTHIR